jgi:hypothetical protein
MAQSGNIICEKLRIEAQNKRIHLCVDSPGHFESKAADFPTNKSDSCTWEIVTQIQNGLESWGLDFIKVSFLKTGIEMKGLFWSYPCVDWC